MQGLSSGMQGLSSDQIAALMQEPSQSMMHASDVLGGQQQQQQQMGQVDGQQQQLAMNMNTMGPGGLMGQQQQQQQPQAQPGDPSGNLDHARQLSLKFTMSLDLDNVDKVEGCA